MNIIKWLEQAYRSPDGDASIKRILGSLCILSLIIAMFIGGFYINVHFDPNLISAITWIGASCILGTVVEKFSPQIGNIIDKIKNKSSEEENK